VRARFDSPLYLVAQSLYKSCDTSAHTISSVISQCCDNGLYYPVAFCSESLTGAERNYNTHDRKMYVIIRALEDWRHFLEGLPETFEIWTNQANLQYWTNTQNLTQRQARWALWLSRFHFTLTHKPGKLNVLADALSRLPDSKVHDSEDNWNVTVLKPEYFRAAATQTLHSSDDLENSVRACTSCDPSVKIALFKMCSDGSRKLPDGTLEWEEVDGLIFYRAVSIFPTSWTYAARFSVAVTTLPWLVILVSIRLWRRCTAIIGGPVWIGLCAAMSPDVRPVHAGSLLSTPGVLYNPWTSLSTPGKLLELTWLDCYRSQTAMTGLSLMSVI
jgi:hypothetical protein